MTLLPATRPLDPWRWLGAPTLACIGATIVFAVPLKVFGLRLPEPVFPLVPAFAWAVIRPSVLAPFVLLALGLFLDLYWGGPLGLWGVSLLVAYGGVLLVRNIMSGQGLAAMWSGYAVAVALAMAAGFVIASMKALALPNLVAVGLQFAATALLYPFAHRLIQRFEDADVRFR